MAKLNRILFLPRIVIQDVYSVERRLSSVVIQGLRTLQSVAPSVFTASPSSAHYTNQRI